MADTTAITCTEKRENQGVGTANALNTVFTRTFSFPITAAQVSGNLVDVGDSVTLITVPAGTLILGIAAKASAAQTGTLTFNVDGTAFSAAIIPGTDTFVAGAITAGHAMAAADSTLTAVIGTAALAAGTFTVTLVCAAVGSPAAGYTTYTI